MKNYTYAALDEIVTTLCDKAEELRNSAQSLTEYYTNAGNEVPEYATEDIEKKREIAGLIERFIEKNLNPRL